MATATWLGTFIGAVLKECGPMIVEILGAAIKKGLAHEIIDSAAPDDLKDRLQSLLPGVRISLRR